MYRSCKQNRIDAKLNTNTELKRIQLKPNRDRERTFRDLHFFWSFFVSFFFVDRPNAWFERTDMFNPWYVQNETLVGPLTPRNELTLDLKSFLDYAQLVKSNQNRSKRNDRGKYSLNEFLVGRTRMKYFDDSHYLGFATNEYATSSVIQNIERLVVYPDIGYYTASPLQQTSTDNPTTASESIDNERRQSTDRENASALKTKKTQTSGGKKRTKWRIQPENEQSLNGESNERLVPNDTTHSDFSRKYSPQEALNKVLNSPLFNGNNTKTILQSSKSERYYQLTFPLENCGRMYVLAAPTLPCFAVLQPWSHVCRLFQLNPLNPPKRYVRRLEDTPEWMHLGEKYDIKYVVIMPPNLSIMNRRDPVIQEGSIEIITTIFAYDNCDADVQFNSPYGCYNKHEDYDGDTNTHGIGKGIEAHTEICFNMKRQTLPNHRLKNIVPQNMLARIMLYFLREAPPDFERNRNADTNRVRWQRRVSELIRSERALRTLDEAKRRYDRMIERQFSEDHPFFDYDDSGAEDIETERFDEYGEEKVLTDYTKSIFALELFRRTCYALTYLVDVDASRLTKLPFDKDARLDGKTTNRNVKIIAKSSQKKRTETFEFAANRVFMRTEYANLYKFFLLSRLKKLAFKIHAFSDTYLKEPSKHEPNTIYDETRNILHEIHAIWSPISVSSLSNAQTLIDDVFRTVAIVFGENESTELFDHASRVVHYDFPNIFLQDLPFDREYLVTVLSRSKGDFDSLLKIHLSMYERFRTEVARTRIESSRSSLLSLGNRDILCRVEKGLPEKHIDYADKYVLGSKKIPKSCKQSNSMKWALQNVQYFDGDLWLNGRLAVKDVMRYFSMNLFADTTIVDLVLNDVLFENGEEEKNLVEDNSFALDLTDDF